MIAIDRGVVGTKVIQRLIKEAPKFLTNNDWLVFVVNLGHGPFLIQLYKKSNYYNKILSFTDSVGNI